MRDPLGEEIAEHAAEKFGRGGERGERGIGINARRRAERQGARKGGENGARLRGRARGDPASERRLPARGDGILRAEGYGFGNGVRVGQVKYGARREAAPG